MREFLNCVNFNAIDRINSVTAESLQKCVGEVLPVVGVAMAKDERDGAVVDAAYVKTADGLYYNTISATAIQALDGIADLLTDNDFNGVVNVGIMERQSANKRNYLLLKLETPASGNTSGN